MVDARRERLRNYLRRDEDGMRKEMLALFLDGGTHTTDEVTGHLQKRKFKAGHREVCASLGLLRSRMGVLGVKTRGRKGVYFIKEGHREMVKAVLENF
jgi:hypothetical protein